MDIYLVIYSSRAQWNDSPWIEYQAFLTHDKAVRFIEGMAGQDYSRSGDKWTHSASGSTYTIERLNVE